MKIIRIRENPIKLNLSLSNSMFSFKEMTTSIVKVEVDDGKNIHLCIKTKDEWNEIFTKRHCSFNVLAANCSQ